MARRFLGSTVVLSALLLGGCGYEPLYSQLDEHQANEMLALLVSQGHDARKVYADKHWMLQVSRSDLAPAMRVLKAEGLPRERYESLGEVFAKQGLVSTPLEERARLLHALSQELARTLSSIDGVVAARVHLAIPEHTPMDEERTPSSASVFIKHRPGAEIVNKTASVKSLVVNGVEGLPYDNVSVTFFVTAPLANAPEPPVDVDKSALATLLPSAALPLVLAIPLVIMLGALVLRRRKT